MFLILFDWDNGKTDPEKGKREVEKWAENKAFQLEKRSDGSRPKCDWLPDGFLQKIIQVYISILPVLTFPYF